MDVREVTEQSFIWLLIVDWTRHGRRRYYTKGTYADVELTLRAAGMMAEGINALSIIPTSKPLTYLGKHTACRVDDAGKPSMVIM